MSSSKQFWFGLLTAIIVILIALYAMKIWFFHNQQSVNQPPTTVNTASNYTNPSKTDPKVIDWLEADKHYGEYVIVAGTVIAVHKTEKACFLNFHSNYRRYFTAVIFAFDYPKFPSNMETIYSNKKVRITGTIEKYQAAPEIVVNDPAQIEIVK